SSRPPEKGTRPLSLSIGVFMRFSKILPCAAAVFTALFFSSSRIIGQSSSAAEPGHTFALHAAGAALPDALVQMDTMLGDGRLDIQSSQDDTQMAGRVHERLKQMYKGEPVFGGQH